MSNGRRNPSVFIDGYNLALEQGTGVATYARNLSFALRDLGAEVGVLYGLRLSAFTANSLLREVDFFDTATSSKGRIAEILRRLSWPLQSAFGDIATQIPITGRVIRETFRNRLPYFDHIWNVRDLFEKQRLHMRLMRRRFGVHIRRRPDVMHWTYPLALLVHGARNVYTLHDLVPLRLPYTTLDRKCAYFRLCQMLVRRADHIITVSESSRRDIINLLGIAPERITNTYQSVEIPPRYANKPLADVRAEIEGTFGLAYKGYFLFFGAIEPKKNVGRLLEAYLGSGVKDPLVLVGKRAWKSEEELRLLFGNDHVRYLLTRDGITETRFRVRHIDYAPFPLLVSLIRGAKAVLFPSLYEGFGLPALEAMLLGTPVMTSNTSSLPEVVGKAALTIDPYDVRAMVEAIRALDRNEALRAQLAESGPKQAALFSPPRYQQRLREAYAQVGVYFGDRD